MQTSQRHTLRAEMPFAQPVLLIGAYPDNRISVEGDLESATGFADGTDAVSGAHDR
jgi:hypothetical protein